MRCPVSTQMKGLAECAPDFRLGYLTSWAAHAESLSSETFGELLSRSVTDGEPSMASQEGFP